MRLFFFLYNCEINGRNISGISSFSQSYSETSKRVVNTHKKFRRLHSIRLVFVLLLLITSLFIICYRSSNSCFGAFSCISEQYFYWLYLSLSHVCFFVYSRLKLDRFDVWPWNDYFFTYRNYCRFSITWLEQRTIENWDFYWISDSVYLLHPLPTSALREILLYVLVFT